MMKIDYRFSKEHPTRTMTHRVAGAIGVALLLMTGSRPPRTLQQPHPQPPTLRCPQSVIQDGFIVHNTVDLGGHMADISGSGAMYDTLVNIHCGPRVLGQTITLPRPGSKQTLFDNLTGVQQRLRRRSATTSSRWTSPRASSTSSRACSVATGSTLITTCWAA